MLPIRASAAAHHHLRCSTTQHVVHEKAQGGWETWSGAAFLLAAPVVRYMTTLSRIILKGCLESVQP